MTVTALDAATALRIPQVTKTHLSYWTRNHRAVLNEQTDNPAGSAGHHHHDLTHNLPASGRQWWRRHAPAEQVSR